MGEKKKKISRPKGMGSASKRKAFSLPQVHIPVSAQSGRMLANRQGGSSRTTLHSPINNTLRLAYLLPTSKVSENGESQEPGFHSDTTSCCSSYCYISRCSNHMQHACFGFDGMQASCDPSQPSSPNIHLLLRSLPS
ncbi:Uncharacterized protein TCM_019999 [Theobroma cacao]|uniref:Uncharacterized protein n=1 Tax=Theobroma cacao TaxID=3641 RepID=A0A061EII3_THECC|nr:Uncharacterized protein TCM_019999 [Theobroma cacao]